MLSAGKTIPRVILASASPYRRSLMEQLPIPFEAVAPQIDETILQNDAFLTPGEIASQLALFKAKTVAFDHPEEIVIGSDQVAVNGEHLLTKPGSRAENISQLMQLSGKTHQLITAVCVLQGAEVASFQTVSQLTMRLLTTSEIERYVDLDQPHNCAGGYRWEAAGITLFERIETEDHSAILGLPLIQLTTVLRNFGLRLP